MSTHPFLKSLRLKNLLSFGPEGTEIDLLPLNVLIGPNGSGKSNLIEAIGLLESCGVESLLPKRISQGGGISEWIWKGGAESEAEIEAIVNSGKPLSIKHRLVLGKEQDRMTLADEQIEDFPASANSIRYYTFDRGKPVLLDRTGPLPLPIDMLRPNESIIGAFRDPQYFSTLSFLGDHYQNISLYRGWDMTRYSLVRQPSRADLPSDRLLPDATNLSIVLSNILSSSMNEKMERRLRRFHDGYQKVTTSIFGGNVQIYLDEKRSAPISAYQMSDGFLRYLCLLAILCHPDPPPVICIEEPEIGLHPDMILEVIDLLVEASERSQIIITTHSDMIVDDFTETPENVVVFEKEGASSAMKRLDRKKLKAWLKKYRLGELWATGQLGGTRW